MKIEFTIAELQTINADNDDYLNYDDDDEIPPEELFGGSSVASRVESIQEKISIILKNSPGKLTGSM